MTSRPPIRADDRRLGDRLCSETNCARRTAGPDQPARGDDVTGSRRGQPSRAARAPPGGCRPEPPPTPQAGQPKGPARAALPSGIPVVRPRHPEPGRHRRTRSAGAARERRFAGRPGAELAPAGSPNGSVLTARTEEGASGPEAPAHDRPATPPAGRSSPHVDLMGLLEATGTTEEVPILPVGQ